MRTLTTTIIALLVTSLLLLALAPGASAAPEPQCYETISGPDYHQFLCVDAADPTCPVYTITYRDGPDQKRCITG